MMTMLQLLLNKKKIEKKFKVFVAMESRHPPLAVSRLIETPVVSIQDKKNVIIDYMQMIDT